MNSIEINFITGKFLTITNCVRYMSNSKFTIIKSNDDVDRTTINVPIYHECVNSIHKCTFNTDHISSIIIK